jgi:diacylglycerol kinase (ATP)
VTFEACCRLPDVTLIMSNPTESSPACPSAKRSGPLRALVALRHSGALLMPVSAIERVLLIVSVLLVLLVELLNSSIEAAIDRISLERHELSKRAKDCGSAAVTIALVICAVTWGVLCGPIAYHWLGG